MHIDHQKLSVFIEHAVDKALEEGIRITTISGLNQYLNKNQNEEIKVIDYKG